MKIFFVAKSMSNDDMIAVRHKLSSTTKKDVEMFWDRYKKVLTKIKCEKISSFRHDVYTGSREYFIKENMNGIHKTRKINRNKLSEYYSVGEPIIANIYKRNFSLFFLYFN